MRSTFKRHAVAALALATSAAVAAAVTLAPAAQATTKLKVRGAEEAETYTTARTAHSVVLHWAEASQGDDGDGSTTATSWTVAFKAGTTAPKASAKPFAKQPQAKDGQAESVTITGLKSGKPYTASIIGTRSGATSSGALAVAFSTRAAGAHSLTIKTGKTHDSTLPKTASSSPDLAIATGPGGHRYAAYATFKKVMFSSASADGPWSKPIVLARGEYMAPVRITQSNGNVAVAWSNFSAPLYRVRRAGSMTWSKPVDLRPKQSGGAGIEGFKIDADGNLHALINTQGRLFYRTNASGTWTSEHLPGVDGNHAYHRTARLVVDPLTQRVVVVVAITPRNLGSVEKPVLVLEVADAASTSSTMGPWHVTHQVQLNNPNMAITPAVASRGGAITFAVAVVPYLVDPRQVTALPPVNGIYLMSGATISTVGNWSRVPGTTNDRYEPVLSMSSSTTAQLMYGRHSGAWVTAQQGIFWRTIHLSTDGSWTADAAHHPTSSAYAIPATITHDQNGHTFVSYVVRAKGTQDIEAPS